MSSDHVEFNHSVYACHVGGVLPIHVHVIRVIVCLCVMCFVYQCEFVCQLSCVKIEFKIAAETNHITMLCCTRALQIPKCIELCSEAKI